MSATPEETVRLRPMIDADREFIRAVEDEHEGNAMAGVRPRTDEQFDSHWRRVLGDPLVRSWIIEQDGEPVGFVTSFVTPGATEPDAAGEPAEFRFVGYRIGRSWWGRGLATRGLRLMLEQERERPLWASVSASNAASLRVLASCGFREVERRWSPATGRLVAGDEVVCRLD